MRRWLEFLYDAAAWLAALAMVGILFWVLAAIVSRQLGFNLPGTDAYAGYCMAASGFLALAHTLKRNEHIRVTLLLGRLRGAARRGMELWALSMAVLLGGLFAVYSVRLAWVSHAINDVSTGNDATPLWIPQIAMGLGAAILFIALLDEWVLELRGRRQVMESEEALHNE